MTWRRRCVASRAASPVAAGRRAEASSAAGGGEVSLDGASTGASDGAGAAEAGAGCGAVAAAPALDGIRARPVAVPAGSARGARPPTDQVSPARGRYGTVTRPPGVKSIRSLAWAIDSSYWTPGWRAPTPAAVSPAWRRLRRWRPGHRSGGRRPVVRRDGRRSKNFGCDQEAGCGDGREAATQLQRAAGRGRAGGMAGRGAAERHGLPRLVARLRGADPKR